MYLQTYLHCQYRPAQENVNVLDTSKEICSVKITDVYKVKLRISTDIKTYTAGRAYLVIGNNLPFPISITTHDAL